MALVSIITRIEIFLGHTVHGNSYIEYIQPSEPTLYNCTPLGDHIHNFYIVHLERVWYNN